MKTYLSYILFPYPLFLIKPGFSFSQIIIETITLTFLLFLSALFSGSEVAYFSLSPSQTNRYKGDSSTKSLLIIRHLKTPKKLLATLLIANTFVNVAIIILSSFLLKQLFDFSTSPIIGFTLEIIGITFILLLFGEILPKVYATQKPLQFARFMSTPILYIEKLLLPLSILLIESTRIIDKRLAKKAHNISLNELSHALDLTSSDHEMSDEKKILRGIVEFGHIDVKEIMSARTDIVAVEINTPFKEICQTIIQAGYSRIPVYKEQYDKIEGILYIKDLLPHINNPEFSNWQSLIRPAFFIPESKKINELLHEFQDKKIHMAIVVDEYGGTSGIITLEDIIEEIVGEIDDEFDDEQNIVYSKINENEYIFEAKTSIIDFAKVFNIDPELFNKTKGESDSIAGLILELEGKIPEKNTSIHFKQFTFQIESADKRRIKRVRVLKKSKPQSSSL